MIKSDMAPKQVWIAVDACCKACRKPILMGSEALWVQDPQSRRNSWMVHPGCYAPAPNTSSAFVPPPFIIEED